MEFVLLADRPDAIPTVARWYFDQWGRRVAGNSYEQTCERLKEKLNRDCLPLPVLVVDGDAVLGTAQLKIREMSIYRSITETQQTVPFFYLDYV